MISAFFNDNSPNRSEYLSPSRERSERSVGSTATASPTNSIASSCRTASSVASTGVKTRQIRDLKLELEFRDSRIHELESAYDELERKADFSRGEVESKLSSQSHELEHMSQKQQELQEVIAAQARQLTEVSTTLEQYKAMQSMMATLMGRCKELEEQQRAQEEAQRQAKADAERAAAAAAELAAEEARVHAERREAETARLAAEEAAAEEEAKRRAVAAAQQQQVVATAVPPQAPTAATRPTLARFRPGANGGPTRRECCVM